MRVRRNHRLIPLVLLPGNVPSVVVLNQGDPFRRVLVMSIGLACLPFDDSRSRFSLAVRVSSRIKRISKNFEDGVIDRQLPHQAALALLEMESRQPDLLSTEPQQHLPRASEFSHFAEDEIKAFLNSTIWVHLDLAVLRPAEPDGKTKLQFAPPSLLTQDKLLALLTVG